MKYFFSILFLLLFSIAGHATQELCLPVPTQSVSNGIYMGGYETYCITEGYVYNLTYTLSTGYIRFQLTNDSAGTSVIYTSVSGSSQPLWIDAGKNPGILGSIILGSMALSAQNNRKKLSVTYAENASDSTAVSILVVHLP